MSFPIEPAFLALPLRDCAAAALQAAAEAGASHADVRIERLRGQDVRVRDARLESLSDDVTIGLAVRVVSDGTWGFASSADVTVDDRLALEVHSGDVRASREGARLDRHVRRRRARGRHGRARAPPHPRSGRRERRSSARA